MDKMETAMRDRERDQIKRANTSRVEANALSKTNNVRGTPGLVVRVIQNLARR